MTAVRNRAAIVTTAILQTVRKGLLSWLDGDRPDTASIRIKIQTLLRDAFTDVARDTLNQIRREDG
jgi:hypothetical protein